MTPIYNKRIDHPMAWKGSDFKSKDDFAFDLTASHIEGLKDILLRAADIPLTDISRKDAGHPALDDDFSKLMDEIMHGRGFVLMRGLPVDDYSVEEIEKMFWSIGTHLGYPVSQNSFGMLMSRVQEERLADGTPATRGTKSRHELALHSDETDILGLCCVRTPESGGETQFASALTIHNEILEKRPDVLPILYEGFPHHRRGEQPDDQPVVSPYNVPVFCNVDGNVSGCIVFGSIMAGLHAIGREPTPEEIEALDMVQDLAFELQYDLTWEPGEIVWINNWTMFHSRSDFVNGEDPKKQRMLLRYWLEAGRDQRPIPNELHFMHNKGWRCGIDKVPGREKKIATNDYLELPPSIAKIIQEQQQRRKKRVGVTATV